MDISKELIKVAKTIEADAFDFEFFLNMQEIIGGKVENPKELYALLSDKLPHKKISNLIKKAILDEFVKDKEVTNYLKSNNLKIK